MVVSIFIMCLDSFLLHYIYVQIGYKLRDTWYVFTFIIWWAFCMQPLFRKTWASCHQNKTTAEAHQSWRICSNKLQCYEWLGFWRSFSFATTGTQLNRFSMRGFCLAPVQMLWSTHVDQRQQTEVIFNVVFVAELVLRLRSVGIRLAASWTLHDFAFSTIQVVKPGRQQIFPLTWATQDALKFKTPVRRFTKQSKQRPLRNPILPDMKPDILSYSFSTWTWSAMRLGRVNFMWWLAEVTAAHSGEVLLPL